jgi:hypothetical protein
MVKEASLCPDYAKVGVFIEQVLSNGEAASCAALPAIADGLRIGRLLGYPPTPQGVAPVINGHSLTPVNLHGAIGYRDTGWLPGSFWILVPTAHVQLFFTYSVDPAVSARILDSVRVS